MSFEKKLRIAIGLPEWAPFQDAMSGRPADATYVIQGNLARGLEARGHMLIFAAPCSPDQFVFTDDIREPRIARRSWSAGLPFEVVSKAAWRVQKAVGIPYLNVFSNYRFMDAAVQALKDCDVIYERNGLYNAGLGMAAARLGKPYVIFFEADQLMELDIMKRPVTGWLRRRAESILRFNLKTADCIICVTKAGKKHLIEQWKVPGDKILVFPNAVDVDKFKPSIASRERKRASLGLGNQPLIIFVGNFFQWHDVDTLLEGFRWARQSCPEARLVLVGDGERRAQMMERASELDLEGAARFTGIVSHTEVPGYIAAADIAVVPYPPMKQEMWLSPLKLFEYMACGKAIVASATGQIKEVIRPGENGLLVSPGEANDLGGALVKLIENPELRISLGAQARQDAVAQFSWDHYLSRLERVFAAVMKREPVGSL